jgi:hypothetical protein
MNTTQTTNKFAVELLYTDTVCWEVIASTAKTLTLRAMREGEVISNSGGPCPIVRCEALPNESGHIVTIRRRKDGTYRIGGGHPLHFTDNPTYRTDYSF